MDEEYFFYKGVHCLGACDDLLAGKMCQCAYDRLYERTTLEHPGQELPPIAVGADLVGE